MFKLKCDDFLTYDEATGTYSVSPDQQVRDEVEKTRWKEIAFKILTDWRLYLMLVPMLFVYFFWRYMPMTELTAVFKDYFSNTSDPAAGNWYGLENFIYVYFNGGAQITQEFWMSFRNTFILAFYGLLFGFPFPIILALFFNEIRSNIVRSVAQVCVYLPKFMSIVVISTLAITLFGTNSSTGAQGVVARLLVSICGEDSSLGQAAANITQEGSGLIYSARYFRALYIVTDLWEPRRLRQYSILCRDNRRFPYLVRGGADRRRGQDATDALRGYTQHTFDGSHNAYNEDRLSAQRFVREDIPVLDERRRGGSAYGELSVGIRSFGMGELADQHRCGNGG